MLDDVELARTYVNLTAIVIDRYLYVIGHSFDELVIERAQIKDDNSLGAFRVQQTWKSTSRLQADVRVAAGKVGKKLFVFAGEFLVASIDGDGDLGDLKPYESSQALLTSNGFYLGATTVTFHGENVVMYRENDSSSLSIYAKSILTGKGAATELEDASNGEYVNRQWWRLDGLYAQTGDYVYILAGEYKSDHHIDGEVRGFRKEVHRLDFDGRGRIVAASDVKDVRIKHPRKGAAGVAIGKYFYLIGGTASVDHDWKYSGTTGYDYGTPGIERAAIAEDGSITGDFVNVTCDGFVPIARCASAVIGDRLYLLGGQAEIGEMDGSTYVEGGVTKGQKVRYTKDSTKVFMARVGDPRCGTTTGSKPTTSSGVSPRLPGFPDAGTCEYWKPYQTSSGCFAWEVVEGPCVKARAPQWYDNGIPEEQRCGGTPKKPSDGTPLF